MNPLQIHFELDPYYPFSDPSRPAFWLAGLGVLLLIFITLAAYRGVSAASTPRVLLLLGLRLLAFVLALAALFRPTLVGVETEKAKALIILALDDSKSMATADEADGQTRLARALAHLEAAKPILTRLEEEHGVAHSLVRFSNKVQALQIESPGAPEGILTDFGGSMKAMEELRDPSTEMLGLLVLSDGIDTSSRRVSPKAAAAAWRRLDSPVHTFWYGSPAADGARRDVGLVDIRTEPTPRIAHGGEMRVTVEVDAPGYVQSKVRFKLLINGEPVDANAHLAGEDAAAGKNGEVVLRQSEGNLVVLRHRPVQALGEVQITVVACDPTRDNEPLPGEQNKLNNRITTFAQVTKEGLSVLLVDKQRAWEPQVLADTLAQDKNITVYTAWLRGDKAEQINPDSKDLLDLQKRFYDVIILGDITPQQLEAASPGAAAKIEEMVAERGAGFLMMGGYASFGNGGWQNTAISRMLPLVMALAPPVEEIAKMVPTAEGLRLCAYFMSIAEPGRDSRMAWDSLREIDGFSRLGRMTGDGTLLANNAKGDALLVAKLNHGKGRVLAFAGDTSHRWIRDKASKGLHHRFWQRLARWLARHEQQESKAYLELDSRRLSLLPDRGLGFRVGVNGPDGKPLENASLKVTLLGPGGKPLGAGGQPAAQAQALALKTDMGDTRGEVDPAWLGVPGVYTVRLEALAKLPDGAEIKDTMEARFEVFQDDRELNRLSSDPRFLEGLAQEGGGTARRGEELLEYLRSLAGKPKETDRKVTSRHPDWKSNGWSPFLMVYLFLFLSILCVEWALRRMWGLA